MMEHHSPGKYEPMIGAREPFTVMLYLPIGGLDS